MRNPALLFGIALSACTQDASSPQSIEDSGADSLAAGDSGSEASDGSVGDDGLGGSAGTGGSGGSGGTGGSALGSARNLGDTCTHSGKLPDCIAVEVVCPGLPARVVDLNIIERAAGTPDKGTVVLGAGGNGTDFYLGAAYGPDVLSSLTNAGFRVVDRAWPATKGWYADHGFGLRASGCRYATLVDWLRRTYHKAGGFCVSGNSGGSAEIGYSLTAWATESVIDLAVPSGGPAVARLDYACGPRGDSAWLSECDTNIPDGVGFTCKPGCFLNPTQEECTLVSATPTPDQLRSDSVMHVGAVVNYPRTRVHFLNGTADCGPTIPNGMTWGNAITSGKSIEWVMGMPHGILSSTVGRDALVRTITSECVSRH